MSSESDPDWRIRPPSVSTPVQFRPPEWLATLADQIAGASAAIDRALGPAIGVAEQARRHVAAFLEANADTFAAIARAAEQVRDTWLTCTPENWRDLEADELFSVLSLGQRTGICMVWAPRAEVVSEVVSAWDRASGDAGPPLRVLEVNRARIIEDLEAVLGQVTGTEIAGHAEATAFATEAVAAARDGHLHAAQALAASGIGQILHVTLNFPAFKGLTQARKTFSAIEMDEATIWVIKWWLIQLSTAVALTDTKNAPVDGFNRHATHHGKRAFFGDGNALAGLLLLTAWVRELQWIAEELPELLSDDGGG